jgi:hypothetical protein
VMRHVDGLYTQRFNRSHGRDGSLFRGRYRAILIDADEYLAAVVRCIHLLNPLRLSQAKVWEQTIGFGRPPLSGDVLYPKQMGRERSFFEGVIKLRVSRDKERLLDCCCGEVETVVDCTMRATRDFQS